MSFTSSNAAFRKAFGISQQNSTSPPEQKENTEAIINDFLLSMKNYLDQKKNVPGFSKLSSWIGEGGDLSSFLIRDDVYDDARRAMFADKIPFVVVSSPEGDLGMMIRSDDEEETKAVMKRVLEGKAQYHARVTGQELKNIVANSDESDKNVVELRGLTPTEAAVLEQKADGILDGYALGVDEMMDGTTTISLHGRSVMMRKRKKKIGIFQAYLEAMLAANGANRKGNEKRTRNTEKVWALIARRKELEKEKKRAYIAGIRNQMLLLMEQGFSYGHVTDAKSLAELESSITVQAGAENYDSLLGSYLGRMGDLAYTTSRDIAEIHAVMPNSESDRLSVERSAKVIQTEIGEHTLAGKLDDMIERKTKSEQITLSEGNWGGKFTHYEKEAAAILAALAAERIPRGYEKEDMLALKGICDEYNIDPMMYVPAIEKLHAPEVVEVLAEQERIHDLDKLIAEVDPNFAEREAAMRGRSLERFAVDREEDREKTEKEKEKVAEYSER